MSPCSFSRPRSASRIRLRGSGASARTKSATCGSNSTFVFIQHRERKVAAFAGLVSANGSHGLRVGQNLHRFQKRLHPLPRNDKGQRFVVARNRDGVFCADKLWQLCLRFGDIERRLHWTPCITRNRKGSNVSSADYLHAPFTC